MQWLKNVFSGAADASRVNPAGLVLMAVGVALAALAGRIARRFCEKSPDAARNLIKLIGMLICAGGALLAILG